MRFKKKFVIIGVLAVVLLAGSLGGVALANTEEASHPANNITDRVAEILNDNGVEVTTEQLQAAFDQARDEMREAFQADRQANLDTLLEAGKITQEQYDRMLSRLENAPERPQRGLEGNFGGRGFPGGPRDGGPFCPPDSDES